MADFKKKKVCILQNGLARGGTDTFVVNLCKGLDKNKFDITVVNPSDKDSSRVRESEILSSGAKIVHTFPLTGIKGKLLHFFKLYKFLKFEKIDIFQTNIDLFNGPNLLIAWLAGVPVRCCHSHNSRQNREFKQGFTFSLRMYQWMMRKMCLWFSTHKCGCSQSAMSFLYPEYNWEKNNYPTIIQNGIDLHHFQELIDFVSKKKELGLTAPKHILTIGHFIKQKNPGFTAKVFAELSQVRSDVDLLWVGEGELKESIVDFFKKRNLLDRVHFLGYRSDINEIMQCSDLFILPSNFEGLGIVAIEAQAAGLSCILSKNVPPEANCGAALYMSLDDTEQWLVSINRILNGETMLTVDPYRLNKFSIEYMSRQMTEVFES